MRLQHLFLSASLTVVAALPALAQEETETVVVSASRISLQGYQAPTPVLQIGREKIERDAKIDIGDLIRELPSAGPSPSLNNGGNSHQCQPGRCGSRDHQPAQSGHRAHPGPVRRTARGLVQPSGRRRRSRHFAGDPGQARRCGDRRRLRRLGLGRGGRRGQSGAGQGIHRPQGQPHPGRRHRSSTIARHRWEAAWGTSFDARAAAI